MTQTKRREAARITVVVGEFPKRSETFVLDQVVYLVRAGHKVTVICERRGDLALLKPKDRDVLADTKVLQLVSVPGWLARWLPWRFVEGLQSSSRAYFFWASRPDVVLAHFSWNGAHVVPLLKRNGAHLVTVYHGYDVSVPWQSNRMSEYSSLFQMGKLHLPVSQFFAELLVAAGAPRDRVQVHHLGVSAEEYAFRAPVVGATLRLLSICRLVEKKGLATAIGALALLRQSHPNLAWSYEIGGEGPEEKNLRELVKAAKLENYVSFLGPLQHEEALMRIRQSDVLLQPSVTAPNGDKEGIPVVLMEAMAVGTIVCSTRHSGIPELVEDGVSGLLSDEHNEYHLAENIKRIATGEVDLAEMAHEARIRIETDYNAGIQNALLVNRLLGLLRP
jgi:colanic acid/amylovoran biosynthesis glycosyltransferase